MKIYTKTGDGGTTGLFAGPRVSKDHPRIDAYGSVDELNACLGVLLANLTPVGSGSPDQADNSSGSKATNQLGNLLREIQSDLFSIGGELATPEPDKQAMALLQDDRIRQLETWIDEYDAQLPPLKQFVLPSGSPAAAHMHLARTVCRRAERAVVHLSSGADVADCRLVLTYLNRLSDLLFVLARWENQRMGIADQPWSRPDSDYQAD